MISSLREFGARRTLTAVLALGLVGIVAVPVINAASGAPAAVSNPADAAANAAPGAGSAGQVDEAALNPAAIRVHGAGLGRVVRGDLVVQAKDGTFVNVHFERGRISAISATSITIVGSDGKGATFAVTATTRVRSKGQLEKVGDLAVGQNAMVLGTGQAGSYSAVLIRGLVARPTTGGDAPAPSGAAAP